MALEDLVGPDKTIPALESENPAGADKVYQGAAHIRGIKNVILNQFPQIAQPVTATADILEQDVEVIDALFPVGMVHHGFDPNGILPGAWQEYAAGRFLRASEPGDTPGTGGAKTHALTAQEMPAHSHSVLNENIADTLSGQPERAWRDAFNLQTSVAGQGEPHENMPAYIVIPMFVRVS